LLGDLVRGTRAVTLFALAYYAASRFVAWPDAIAAALNVAALAVLLVQAALWAGRAVDFAIRRYAVAGRNDDAACQTAVGAARVVVRIAVWTVVLLLILDNMGLEITGLVAGLGIGGVAVALAAQNILSDLFSALSIVLDRPFVVGDFIIVGEDMGAVEHVGLKTTRVRSLWGEELVFSNADILQSRIRNYGTMSERRVQLTVDVAYETPSEELERLPSAFRDIIQSQKETRFDRAHFARYAESSLQFEIVYYLLSSDYNEHMDVLERINFAIFRLFQQRGLQFAYPTRTVHVAGGGAAMLAGAGASR
jgi:small-conductance mechanosensitive channel